MSNFTIKIANSAFGVTSLFDTTYDYCKDYLWDGVPDFSVVVTPDDIQYEREQNQKIEAKEGVTRRFSNAYLELIALQRKVTECLMTKGLLLFHGSVIAVDGRAYLFTATSGTGKSTHTRLWREMLGDRAIMVNDDKPFLSVQDGVVMAHGSPWCGKHRLGTNISVPLSAICILKRGECNEIHPITPKEALPMLIQQSARPQDATLMPKYMETLDGVACGVDFYTLTCNMNPEAARVAYEAMSSNIPKSEEN